jgi:hypothetical protein
MLMPPLVIVTSTAVSDPDDTERRYHSTEHGFINNEDKQIIHLADFACRLRKNCRARLCLYAVRGRMSTEASAIWRNSERGSKKILRIPLTLYAVLKPLSIAMVFFTALKRI